MSDDGMGIGPTAKGSAHGGASGSLVDVRDRTIVRLTSYEVSTLITAMESLALLAEHGTVVKLHPWEIELLDKLREARDAS